MNWYNWNQKLGFCNQGHTCRIYVPLGNSHATLSRAEAAWMHDQLSRFFNDE